jgi:Uma2 family endonuclease
MYNPKPSITVEENPWPTMYDLPSEEIGDSGLPDQYHFWQGELLSETFVPGNYPANEVFVACDLNLYYDLDHSSWYKRPDWFAVVGVDRFYEKTKPRLSYVIWQEKVKPFIIVELLSPSTRKEDLGLLRGEEGKTPYKWEVYEEILQVPYYVVFDGRSNQLRLFKLINGHYQSQSVVNGEYWFAEIELGLKVVFCKYQDLNRLWLRWYDRFDNLIPTALERMKQEKQRAEREKQRAKQEKQRAKQEKQRAEQEKQRADSAELEIARLKALLRQSGIET